MTIQRCRVQIILLVSFAHMRSIVRLLASHDTPLHFLRHFTALPAGELATNSIQVLHTVKYYLREGRSLSIELFYYHYSPSSRRVTPAQCVAAKFRSQ